MLKTKGILEEMGGRRGGHRDSTVAIRQEVGDPCNGLVPGSAVAVLSQPAPSAQAEPKYLYQARLNCIHGAIAQELEAPGGFFPDGFTGACTSIPDA